MFGAARVLTMVLRESVLNAFSVLGISPDTPEDVAKSTYKKLALVHHPDRNFGDAAATQRFQQVCSSAVPLVRLGVHSLTRLSMCTDQRGMGNLSTPL